MNILIRQARPADLPEIARLEQEIEDRPASLDLLRERLAMFPAGFLTAWHAGRLAGYAQSCIWDEKIPKFSPAKNFFRNKHTAQGETLYIIFVGVSPEYQRQGIAGRLIHALREVARENGQKKVHAVTWDHMRKLYVKHGFKPVGKMPGFLPKGEFTMLEYRLEKDG